MSPGVNSLVGSIPPSGIRKVFNLAAELTTRGQRVYPFHLGVPDFDTPDAIKDAAITKLKEGWVHYTPNAGIKPLREAIAKSVSKMAARDIDPDSVIVTVGASEALALSMMVTLEPGSEIIVPTPCFPTNLNLPRLLGATVVEMPLSQESGFVPRLEDVEALITERTRAILINTPSNPTGAALPRKVLADLVGLARDADIWLISDEVYQDVLYDGLTHVGVLHVAEDNDPVIFISGLSKTYSMTGWRLGYIIAPDHVRKAMLTTHQYIVTSACSFAQWGGVTALEEEPGKEEMRAEYQVRRDSVTAGLERAGLSFHRPVGSFFVFPEIPKDLPDDEAFCTNMLSEGGLALVPGTVFGKGFERYFRLCFACATEEVAEGMESLVNCLS